MDLKYGTLINGLCKAGRTQVALKVLRGMRIKGMRPTPKAYNLQSSLSSDGIISEMP